MTEALIRADKLVRRFAGVTAIDEASFALARGEVLGVIGPNGAGKSTLVGLLSGALQPSSGRVLLDGVDVTKLPAAERARLGIGRTHQIPRPFLHMNVRENLLAARLSRQPFEPTRASHAACDAILERCGLADAADAPAYALPLLRRKRLEVARALALQPKLLLLDEVGAGLVDAEVSELIALIASLASELDGIIIVEHVLRIVRACCQRLLVLNFGKQLAEGPTAQVLASEQVAAVYLGSAHDSGARVPHVEHVEHTAEGSTPLPEAAQRASPPLLELRGICAGYGQARVLHDVSLRVHAGEVVALLGVNGAGKSTLAQVIGGLLPVSRGQLVLDGVDVTGWPAHRIARLGIAHCLEGRRIFPSLSVEENLLLTARGVTAPERAARLERVYTLFPDLKARRRSSGTAMSGGQQQMLAIGRALMAQPRLIVFDEISLGLAPVVMDRLYEALQTLRRAGLTLLIIEQDVARALELADTAHVLEHGKIALSGSAQALQRDPKLRQLYIGSVD
jgi:branched-chain amino acid transport system ATP-binding protein